MAYTSLSPDPTPSVKDILYITKQLLYLLHYKFGNNAVDVIFLISLNNLICFERNIYISLARFLHLPKFKKLLFITSMDRCSVVTGSSILGLGELD